MQTQPTMTPSAFAATTVYEGGPNLLVRFIITIGISVALPMANRTPLIASLYRY